MKLISYKEKFRNNKSSRPQEICSGNGKNEIITTMQQLKLFETPATKSLYKAGDWVELKRKSKNVAYLKGGDVVQIEAVHPVNGSIKFWN
jgi:hypothetical protein